jgi:SAM-dependent methyltransferase
VDDAIYEELFRVEAEHWWFRGRRAVIRGLLAHVPVVQPCRFLDAGCGTGYNLQAFADLGDGTGAEPSAEAVAFAERRGIGPIVRSSAESLPFEDASFDLVMAFDVLEHIEDDQGALRELRRVVRPDGALVVTVPAYRWLWSQHDETHHHVRRYTRRALRAAAEASGWQTSCASYFNTLLLPPIALVRVFRRGDGAGRSDYELAGRQLNSALSVPMRLEARAIAHGLRLPAGVSIGAIFLPS